MKKAGKILPIAYYLLLAIQVIFCILWVAKSSLKLPLIYEGSIYLEAARTMKFDEYSGVIYPLFLRFIYLGMSNISGRITVAGLQLVALLFSAVFLINRIKRMSAVTIELKSLDIVLILLHFITFPLVAYIIFLMTPEAFALSFFMVWCGYLFDDKKKPLDIFLMVTAYILAGFMSIKYAYIIGIIWLVYILVMNRSKIFLNLARWISGICFIIIMNILFITPGCYGRMPASMGTGLVCNYSYEVLVHDHFFWPEEAKAAIPFENLGNILMDRSHVVTKMGEPLLNNYSYWKTDILGLQIAKASIMVRSRETIDRFLGNVSDYLLTPVTFLENINGQGKSSSAINIYSMAGGDSRLAVMYMLAGLIINSLIIILASFGKIFDKKTFSFWIMMYLVASVFWALFAFNYFDYMLMMPVIVFGLILLSTKWRLICKSICK